MNGSIKKVIGNPGFEVRNTPCAPALTGPSGTSCSEELSFKEYICEKAKEAQKYKQSFSSAGLAFLLTETPTREAENSYISWIRQGSAKLNYEFDFCYVISERFCLYLDPAADICNRIIISERETKKLRTIARMTAEGDLSPGSPEWNQERVGPADSKRKKPLNHLMIQRLLHSYSLGAKLSAQGLRKLELFASKSLRFHEEQILIR